jgi:hypothetical protein
MILFVKHCFFISFYIVLYGFIRFLLRFRRFKFFFIYPHFISAQLFYTVSILIFFIMFFLGLCFYDHHSL